MDRIIIILPFGNVFWVLANHICRENPQHNGKSDNILVLFDQSGDIHVCPFKDKIIICSSTFAVYSKVAFQQTF